MLLKCLDKAYQAISEKSTISIEEDELRGLVKLTICQLILLASPLFEQLSVLKPEKSKLDG